MELDLCEPKTAGSMSMVAREGLGFEKVGPILGEFSLLLYEGGFTKIYYVPLYMKKGASRNIKQIKI